MKLIAKALGNVKRVKQACAALALCAATAMALPGQSFTTLYSFGYIDGSQPVGTLVQGAAGNLYGITYGGGANGATAGGGTDGWGTVFKITPSGTLTTIYNFCARTDPDGACSDGDAPAGLLQATNGDFYGITSDGGAGVGPNCNGCGTIFEMTPGGALTTIYSFCDQIGPFGTCAPGYARSAALIQGSDGNFYGTTLNGGASQCYDSTYGCGTVFTMTPSGTLTMLYSFCAQSRCTDGAYPWAALVEGTDANFYGITSGGGAGPPCSGSPGTPGCGTVFKITASGSLTTLYSFCSQKSGTLCADGTAPAAGLVQGTDGNFYGTTSAGGAQGAGTVFKITPSGVLTTLYSFCAQSGCTDGSGPATALVQATDGNLYGTTPYGGNPCPPLSAIASGCGTIFRITPGGTLTTLHSFCAPNTQDNCPDGAVPNGLVQGADGNLYGTTYEGELGNTHGTVFRLSPASYLISGQVALSTFPNAFWGGGTVTLSGTQSASATTDDLGKYSFLAAAGGNYTVTPSLPGYTFSPSSQTITNLSANQTEDFIAFQGPEGNGLIVNLGYQFGAAFSGTPPLGGFTVTPHIPGFTITPFSSDDLVLEGNWNGAQAAYFTANAYTGMNFAGSMPHLASGGGQWTTTFTLLNNGAASASVALNFFDDNGNPLPLPLTFPQGSPNQTTAAFTGVLAAGAALVIETAGLNGPLVTGWAQLLSDGDVSGFAVFTDNVTASQQQQAVVPLQSLNFPEYFLWFDNTNGFSTGVALANASTEAATMTLAILDDTGAFITNPYTPQTIELPAQGHTAFVLATNYPMTANLRGTLLFEPAGGQVSVLGLSFNPASAFTSIPVAPLSLETFNPASRTFTHLGGNRTPHFLTPRASGSKSSPRDDANAFAVSLSYQFSPPPTDAPPAGAGITVTPSIPGFTITPFGSQDLAIQNWSGTLTFNFDAIPYAGMSFAGSMPHLASGGGQWTTTFTILSASGANVALNFFDDNGNPLPLPLTRPQGSPNQTTATFTGRVGPDAGLLIQTAGLNNPLATGWAQLLSDGDVSGFAVFTDNVTANQQQQAVVPLQSLNSSAYELWFDNTNGFATGVALANESTAPATMTLVIRDDTGAQITTQAIQLPALGHTAFVLATNYPMTANRRGTVEFSEPADGQISVLGLSFNPASAFTSIPAITP